MRGSKSLFITFISAVILFPMNLLAAKVENCDCLTEMPPMCQRAGTIGLCPLTCRYQNLLQPIAKFPKCIDSLDLQGNNISAIGKEDFAGLTNLTNLILSRNKISAIENGAFNGLTNLKLLFLTGNEISAIEKEAFTGMTNSILLNLAENKISAIEKGAFTGVSDLRLLDLAGNEISAIEKGDFTTLTNLVLLNFTGNKISAIEKGTFTGLANLALLDLTGNKVSAIENGTFSGLKYLRFLNLTGNEISAIGKEAFTGISNLLTLNLRGNKVSAIEKEAFTGLTYLLLLNLRENKVSAIKKGTFSGLTNLQLINLKGNKMSAIEKETFTGLTNLQSLDLSENEISVIEKGAFTGLINLMMLDLRGNELKNTKGDTLEYLTSLRFAYLDESLLCFQEVKLKLKVKVCKPKIDAISSIYHLLDSVLLRISVWAIACVACAGNIAVLAGKLVFSTKLNDVNSFYIKNLALADLLMSIYLFVIAAYDVSYRDEYILYEESWKHSRKCDFCGFVAIFSSESSIFIMAVITTDRYIAIVHPPSGKKRTIFFASIVMVITWAIALLTSGLPLLRISYYGEKFYGNNGMCLPLQIHDPFGPAWEYNTFLFCGVNLIAFLFILYAYMKIFFIISHSKVGFPCTQQQEDRNIAKRFAFIVGTEFFCWMLIILIKIIALAGVSIHGDLYTWVAVFLLLVNSALNPILYLLMTKLFMDGRTDKRKNPFLKIMKGKHENDANLRSNYVTSIGYKAKEDNININFAFDSNAVVKRAS